MLNELQEPLFSLIMTSLKTDDNRIHVACMEIVTEFPWEVSIPNKNFLFYEIQCLHPQSSIIYYPIAIYPIYYPVTVSYYFSGNLLSVLICCFNL